MSAIDTMNHAHVGNFFKLPVYWVFDESNLSNLTDNKNDENEVINKYYLSIGGGSGEHPALIINNDAVLFRFLANVEEIEKPNEESCEQHLFDYKMYQLASEIQDKYFDKNNKFQDINEEICYWNIDQNQWPLETFVRIAKEFETTEQNNESLETKIVDAIALFIINEMPLENCIKDIQLIEFANMYRTHRWSKIVDWKEISNKFIGFTGILNCQKSGKIIRNNKTVWSYGLNDWLKENIKE